MDTLVFTVDFYQDEEGWYTAEAPEMPGCVTQGETLDDAMRNMEEALIGCLEVRRETGLPDRINLGHIGQTQIKVPA